MLGFLKDSLVVSQDIIQRKATGVVVFKFTSDELGKITKMVVCYADDPVLVPPVIDVIKKTAHKWVLPDGEKTGDFIVTFSYNFNPLPIESAEINKAVYDYATTRKPIISENQFLLDDGNLLPAIMVNYDILP